jgi:hypothetical protein
MATTGANVALIKSALNHKDIQTTLNVYARTSRQAEKEARELAHDRMLGTESVGKPIDGNILPFRAKRISEPQNVFPSPLSDKRS